MTAFEIRHARNSDCWDLIGVIAECWAEYPGCVMDVHQELPEMLTPATHYAQIGGQCWVAVDRGRAVASVALAPTADRSWVLLQKLYVAHAARGRGLGSTLTGVVEDEARRRGANTVELWSDTRFTAAHRLYGARGYVRQPLTRELHDLSHSVEYAYRKELGPTTGGERDNQRDGQGQ